MTITLTVTPDELRLLWLGTETLLDANPDNVAAVALDRKVTDLVNKHLDLSPSVPGSTPLH